MRRNITITGCRSGVSYLQITLHQYFNKETEGIFKYAGGLEYDFSKSEIKNLDIFINNQIDFFAVNYLINTEFTCMVIRKAREVSPKTKILFISSTVSKTGKEMMEAGADACFDCETIPVIGGGGMTGGAAVAAVAWILDNFPQEPIENTWSRKR